MCILTLVYLHVSAGACAHTYICVHRKVVDLGCLPQLLSTPVLREVLSLNLELTNSTLLAVQQASRILYLCILRTGIKCTFCHAWLIVHGSGEPNSDPCT